MDEETVVGVRVAVSSSCVDTGQRDAQRGDGGAKSAALVLLNGFVRNNEDQASLSLTTWSGSRHKRKP